MDKMEYTEAARRAASAAYRYIEEQQNLYIEKCEALGGTAPGEADVLGVLITGFDQMREELSDFLDELDQEG